MDPELVERARGGDREAFAGLATSDAPRLFSTAALILRNHDRAAAATQQALLAGWRGVRAVQDADAFEPWLLDLLFQACRRQQKRGRDVLVIDLGLERIPLDRTFRRLTLDQRALVVLVHFLGLPTSDAADIVATSQAAAVPRLERAMEDLRRSARSETLATGSRAESDESPDFESALAGWLEARAPDRPPSDLLGPVLAAVAETRPMPRWRALIAVKPMRTTGGITPVGSTKVRRARLLPFAGVLAVAVSAGAFSFGPRLSTVVAPPPPAKEFTFSGDCKSNLPKGLVAEVSSDEQFFTLASDGWFVGGPPTRSIDADLTGRRMSASGIQRYIDVIRHAHLANWCRELFTSSLNAALITTVDSRPIEVFWNHEWAFSLRVLDPKEEADATALVHRLEHPEEWLPDDGWIVRGPEPYLPTTYRVVVQFPGPTDLSRFRLPNGSTLKDLRLAMHGGSTFGCSELTRGQALAARDRLPPDDGGDPSQGQWNYQIDESNSVSIEITALLPGVDDCAAMAAQFELPNAPPTPSPSPAGGFYACALLPVDRVGEILNRKYRLQSVQDHGRSELGGELTCSFEDIRNAGDRRSGHQFILSFRSQPTERGDATGLARYLFGNVDAEDQPGGGRLWVNGCFLLDLCRPAIAVSRPPYFALLAEWPQGDLTEGQVRSLAIALLDNMRDLPETWRPLTSP